MKTSTLVLVCLLVCRQLPAQQTIRPFGVPAKNDFTEKVYHTSDGYFLVAGQIDNDAALYKFDCNGRLVDSLRKDLELGGSFERFYDVVELPDGDFLAVGNAVSTNGAVHHGALMRVDAQLQEIAFDTFTIRNGQTSAQSIARMNDGRWVIACIGAGVGGFDYYDLYAYTIDPETLELADSITRFSYVNDHRVRVSVAADGSLLFTGSGVTGNLFSTEAETTNTAFVRRTSPTGVLQWQHTRAATFKNKYGRMFNAGVVEDVATGRILVGGNIFSGDTLHPFDAFYLLFSAAGNLLDTLSVNRPGSQTIYQVIDRQNAAGFAFISAGDSTGALANGTSGRPLLIEGVVSNDQIGIQSVAIPNQPFAYRSVAELPGGALARTGIYFNPPGVQDNYDVFLSTPSLSVNLSQAGNVFTVTNPLGAGYSYQWYDGNGAVGGATAPVFTASTPGTYVVIVSDPLGCQATATATFTCTAAATIQTTPTSCFNAATGTAAATATGAAAPVTFLWSNGATTPSVIGLATGTVSVTITDAYGCTATAAGTVGGPAPIIIATAVTPVSCFGGANGSIVPSVSGGTAPYAFSWSSGPMPGPVAGTYCATVTDANGCTATTCATITQPPAIVLTTAAIDAPCHGANGQVTAQATGGVPPLQYKWATGSIGPTLPAGAGTYGVTATDLNGCTATATATVTEPTEFMTAAVTLPDTGSQGVGSIELTVSGATPPYLFYWTKDGIAYDTTNTPALSGLLLGTYAVTIIDAQGCTTVLDNLVVGDLVGIAKGVPWAALSLNPNPAGQEVTIAAGHGEIHAPVRISIWNPDGRLVYHTSEASGLPFRIACAGWPAGVYRVLLATGARSVWKSLVVSR